MAHLDPRNPANAAALRAFEVQHKIRNSTLKLNDEFADLARWERSIKQRDSELERKRNARREKAMPPVRGSAAATRRANTVRTKLGTGAVAARLDQVQKAASERAAAVSKNGAQGGAEGTSSSAAAHTYDKGYKKWENFDVEKALEAVEVEDIDAEAATKSSVSSTGLPRAKEDHRSEKPVYVARTRKQHASPTDISEVFELEKKRGNKHFGNGEFADAIRCYTKCIGYNSRDPVVYSNRAAAYLKRKEYIKARSDCDSALRLDASHIKSLLRRAMANNALGRHCAALRDLAEALKTAPSNKRLKSEMQKTKELHRTSVRKAPRWKVAVRLAEGPQLPTPHTRRQRLETGGVAPLPPQGVEEKVKENAALPLGSSGLKPINSNDEDMEHVPINRRKKNVSQQRDLSPADYGANDESTVPVDDDSKHLKNRVESNAGAEASPVTEHDLALAAAEKAAALTAAAEAARRSAIENLSSPETGYEFLNCWSGLQNDEERAYYLRLIPTKLLKSVFKTVPDSDIFGQMLGALVLVATGDESGAKPKPKRALVYLKKLAAGRRFGMAVMLMSDKDKDAVRTILQRASSSDPELKAKYGL